MSASRLTTLTLTERVALRALLDALPDRWEATIRFRVSYDLADRAAQGAQIFTTTAATLRRLLQARELS
jgi:hypothetical protein